MKFLLIFLVSLTILCGIFWAVDGPGSGMAWPTGIFAALGLLALVLEKRRTKSLNDKAGR